MKAILVVGFIALAVWFGWTLTEQQRGKTATAEQPPAQQVSGPDLAGMHPSLEATLSNAQQRGAAGLRDFLGRYRKTIHDPRLAWIELDYAIMLAKEDPAEARRIYSNVKARVAPSSPVYPRVKQLEKTYE